MSSVVESNGKKKIKTKIARFDSFVDSKQLDPKSLEPKLTKKWFLRFIYHCLRGAGKGYGIGIVLALYRRRKNLGLKWILGSLGSKSAVRLGIMFGLIRAGHKIARYFNQFISKVDHDHIITSLSALFLYMTPFTDATMWNLSLNLFMRTLREWVQTEMKEHDIEYKDSYDTIAFILTSAFVGYFIWHEPRFVSKAYARSLRNIAGLSAKNMAAVAQGDGVPFRVGASMWNRNIPSASAIHPGRSILGQFLYQLPRTLQVVVPMYSAIHVLPSLVLGPHKVIKAPLEFIQRKVVSITWSSLGIGLSGVSVPLVYSYARKIFNDNGIPGFLSGGVGMMPIICERANRHRQYLVYVLPKVLEAVAQRWLLPKSAQKSFLRNQRLIAILLFCLAFYQIDVVDSRGTVGTSSFFMNFVFGQARLEPLITKVRSEIDLL